MGKRSGEAEKVMEWQQSEVIHRDKWVKLKK